MEQELIHTTEQIEQVEKGYLGMVSSKVVAISLFAAGEVATVSTRVKRETLAGPLIMRDEKRRMEMEEDRVLPMNMGVKDPFGFLVKTPADCTRLYKTDPNVELEYVWYRKFVIRQETVTIRTDIPQDEFFPTVLKLALYKAEAGKHPFINALLRFNNWITDNVSPERQDEISRWTFRMFKERMKANPEIGMWIDFIKSQSSYWNDPLDPDNEHPFASEKNEYFRSYVIKNRFDDMTPNDLLMLLAIFGEAMFLRGPEAFRDISKNEDRRLQITIKLLCTKHVRHVLGFSLNTRGGNTRWKYYWAEALFMVIRREELYFMRRMPLPLLAAKFGVRVVNIIHALTPNMVIALYGLDGQLFPVEPKYWVREAMGQFSNVRFALGLEYRFNMDLWLMSINCVPLPIPMWELGIQRVINVYREMKKIVNFLPGGYDELAETEEKLDKVRVDANNTLKQVYSNVGRKGIKRRLENQQIGESIKSAKRIKNQAVNEARTAIEDGGKSRKEAEAAIATLKAIDEYNLEHWGVTLDQFQKMRWYHDREERNFVENNYRSEVIRQETAQEEEEDDDRDVVKHMDWYNKPLDKSRRLEAVNQELYEDGVDYVEDGEISEGEEAAMAMEVTEEAKEPACQPCNACYVSPDDEKLVYCRQCDKIYCAHFCDQLEHQTLSRSDPNKHERGFYHGICKKKDQDLIERSHGIFVQNAMAFYLESRERKPVADIAIEEVGIFLKPLEKEVRDRDGFKVGEEVQREGDLVITAPVVPFEGRSINGYATPEDVMTLKEFFNQNANVAAYAAFHQVDQEEVIQSAIDLARNGIIAISSGHKKDHKAKLLLKLFYFPGAMTQIRKIVARQTAEWKAENKRLGININDPNALRINPPRFAEINATARLKFREILGYYIVKIRGGESILELDVDLPVHDPACLFYTRLDPKILENFTPNQFHCGYCHNELSEYQDALTDEDEVPCKGARCEGRDVEYMMSWNGPKMTGQAVIAWVERKEKTYTKQDSKLGILLDTYSLHRYIFEGGLKIAALDTEWWNVLVRTTKRGFFRRLEMLWQREMDTTRDYGFDGSFWLNCLYQIAIVECDD